MAFIFLAASKIGCSTGHCKSDNSQGVCYVDIYFFGDSLTIFKNLDK